MQISIIFDGVPKFNVKVFAHESHFVWPIVIKMLKKKFDVRTKAFQETLV